MTCVHSESLNPRQKGVCVRCGKLMDEPLRRDLAFEESFLDEVVEVAQRLTGILPNAYPARVRHRLEVGARRYPGDQWRDRDNLKEIAEEPGDIAGYAVLELQRMRAAGTPSDLLEEQRLDLLAASSYAAIADWYVLRALRRSRGDE